MVVIATLERGYYPLKDFTPLGPSDWAKLSCALLAAVGHGYHYQDSYNQEAKMDKVRMLAHDLNPLSPKYPMLFHRLAATADHLETHVSPDQPDYQGWYLDIKKTFNEKATKAAVAKVEEEWLQWKAQQIDRCAAMQEAEISTVAKNRNTSYFITAAAQFRLLPTPGTQAGSNSNPTTGRKCTVLGSITGSNPTTPTASRI
jgi:hypothetical protein